MNNKFSLYWYCSLAETLDPTYNIYINKQGFPTKTLVYFLITMIPIHSIILHM